MRKYIDADALIEEVKTLEQLARKRVYDTPTNSPAYERYATQYSERERILNIIKAHHAADVVEVRHGEWEGQEFDDGFGFKYKNYWCSVCGRKLVGYSDPKEAPYCHCGAKMDGERREK